MNFIKDKLSTSDGVIFGDGSHVNEEPRNFMLRNIDELKAAGVKKLYLEFVDDKYSWALDEYYESDDMTDLARVVGSSCCCAVETLAIIKKCKENGIRCYGIDDPNPEKTSLAERNKYWADKVKSTNLNNEKYMLFCGSGHLSRSAGNVGIDKILPGKIAALETRIPWKVLNGNVPSSYTSCGDNYSILTYKSH